jgi:hypothetical protein
VLDFFVGVTIPKSGNVLVVSEFGLQAAKHLFGNLFGQNSGVERLGYRGDAHETPCGGIWMKCWYDISEAPERQAGQPAASNSPYEKISSTDDADFTDFKNPICKTG